MKYIKRLYEMDDFKNKDKTSILRVAFYDFDGTIIDSPKPDLGKLLWAKHKGMAYPYKGWWSKPHSLDMDIFDIKGVRAVEQRLQKDINNKNCWTVLLTNRLSQLEPFVLKVLNNLNINLDELQMMDKINLSKSMRVKYTLQGLPQANQIDIYDDDDKNISDFLQLKNELTQEGKSVTIYKVVAKDEKYPIRIVE